MHPAPVRRDAAAPLDLPHWAIDEPEPDHALDLRVYQTADEPAAFEHVREAGARFVAVVVCAAGILLFWILVSLYVAHRAGRI